MVLVIYNRHHLAIQKLLWKELSCMSNINIPWLIVGDFNSIISPAEHKGGPYRYYARKAQVFADFIAENALLDIDCIGNLFSWCNGQCGQAR